MLMESVRSACLRVATSPCTSCRVRSSCSRRPFFGAYPIVDDLLYSNRRVISSLSMDTDVRVTVDGTQKKAINRRRPRGQRRPTTPESIQNMSGIDVIPLKDQGRNTTNASTSADVYSERANLILSRASDRMVAFLRTRSTLPPPHPSWLLPKSSLNKEGIEADDEDMLHRRCALHADVVRLLEILHASFSILGDYISPRGGRNPRLCSDLLGNILLLLGDSPPAHLQREVKIDKSRKEGIPQNILSPADAANLVLDLLRRLNLDVTPDQYASAIQAACHDGRWGVASGMFLEQIDPDSAGMVPIDSTLGWGSRVEMGLYAIAKQAKSEATGDVTDQVFDAVQSMSMVSPADQEQYILAAGRVLGRVGEWESALAFLNAGGNVERLGQGLVAAVMQALVDCSQFGAALEIYDEYVSNPLLGGSEWQWGGSYGGVHPVSRDLALCAMGEVRERGLSKKAIDIFRRQIIDERSRISLNGLIGVFKAIERDCDWLSSLDLLRLFLKEETNVKRTWTLVQSTYDVSPSGAATNMKDNTSIDASIHGNILGSAMNTCNAAGEYGLAILYAQLVGLAYAPEPFTFHRCQEGRQVSCLSATVLSSNSLVNKNENVLAATMVSLCGLGCHDEAMRLYEATTDMLEDGTAWPNATACFQHAKGQARNTSIAGSEKAAVWKCAFRDMHRLTSVMHSIEDSRDVISGEEKLLLTNALSHFMSCCTDAGQARTGLVLGEHLLAALHPHKESTSSMASSVLSFLGFGREASRSRERADSGSEIPSLYLANDSLLASTLKANYAIGRHEEAIDLFFDVVEAHESESFPYVQSLNETIVTLGEGNREDAVRLFDEMEDELKTPETYTKIAEIFAAEKDWARIGGTYSSAVKSWRLSEGLALLAMQSIVEQEADGKIPALRAVVDDMARLEGTSQASWIKSRYWTLKRRLGWRHARLLMYWNDPRLAGEDEFLLAIEHLEKAKRDRSTPKNAVLSCIVKYASFHQDFVEGDDAPDGALRRSQVVELVTKAVSEARKTSMGTRPFFIFHAATGLRNLGANAECVEYMREMLALGVRVDQRSLEAATDAAEAEADSGAVEEFLEAMEDSGRR